MGLGGEISEDTMSEYSVANILTETYPEKNTVTETFTADSDYVFGIMRPVDSASIRVVGFAALDTLNGVEILGVTPLPPQGFAITTTGDVPFVISYGLPIAMTVAAAIIGYFLFKNRTTFF